MVHLSPPDEPAALPTVLFVVVHPISPEAHPDQGAGWRWSVMLGPCPPSQVECSVNAGWCPTRDEAIGEGEQNGATALAALAMVGLPMRPAPNVILLDHDPIPAGIGPVRVL